ncbi:LamG domain-containing protein, partial [Nanoarchaeota archaeon]
VSIWVKTGSQSKPSAEDNIIGKWQSSGPWLIRYDSAANELDSIYGNGSATDVTSNSVSIEDNQWHNIVTTYNGTLGKTYLDGVKLTNEGVGVGDIKVDATSDLLIGKRESDVTPDWFNGSIDEVKIYNRTLSAEQVKALYNNRTDVIVSQETLEDEVWYACITPNDGYEDGATNCSINITIQNTPPSFTYTNITPDPAYTDDTLSVNITPTDVDIADTLNVWVKWFVNGVLTWWQLFTGVVSGSTVEANLSSSNFSKGDSIFARLFVGDEAVNATAQNTSTETIPNKPPEHTQPLINATDNPVNGTAANLTVYNQSTTDADDDNVTNIINWYRNDNSITILNMPFEGGSTSGTPGNNGFTKDYSGLGNNGTVVNVTWNSTAGYDGGGAYVFDTARNDHINVGSEFDSVNNVSVAFWVNLQETIGTSYIFNKYGNAENAWGFYTNYVPGGETIEIYDDIDGVDLKYYTTALTHGVWYHIVGTMGDNGDGTYENRLYIDGTLIGSGNNSNASWSSISGTVYLGDRHSAAGGRFNGTIDDLRIYNHTLSPEQIKALYNNRTDLIVSDETTRGETWKACITPNDAAEDGAANCSNNLTIGDTPPSAPTSVAILPATVYKNTTINATASGSTDIDGDTITYLYQFRDSDNSTILQNYSSSGLFNCSLSAACTRDDTIYVHALASTTNANSSVVQDSKYINNSIPSKVTLLVPNTGNNTLFNRYLYFNWTNSTDIDGDDINYTLNITSSTLFNCGPDVTYSNIQVSNYTTTDLLCVDYYYNWTVIASDGTDSIVSDIFNFTIKSYVIMNLTANLTDFGSFSSGSRNTTNDTDNIEPFVLENIGNIDLDIRLHAADGLWESSGNEINNSYFMFMAGNYSTKPASFVWQNQRTQTTFTNVTGYALTDAEYVLGNLSWNTSKNAGEIELYVEVPPEEFAGEKSSQIVITGAMASG